MFRVSGILLLAFVTSLGTIAQTEPQVTTGTVSFVDTPGVPSEVLNQIAQEVQGSKCSQQEVSQCIGERVRDAFQERGYFMVSVAGVRLQPEVSLGVYDAAVSASPGAIYRISQLQMGGKLLPGDADIGRLMTIHIGQIFNLREVRITLENLRQYYAARGYSNAYVIPSTEVDETTHGVCLKLQIGLGG